jgi:prepilin-type N-terminal cleavage/methylation domain-containing protein
LKKIFQIFKEQAFGLNFKFKTAGFTLIEMIVVMAMIGIVSGATLKLVRFSDINKNLSLTTAEVKGAIRTAQTLALAPPLVTDNSDKVLHVCGFVVENTSSSLGELEIKTVLPKGDDPVICRKLSIIGEICDNGSTTTCQSYEKKDFESFKIISGTNNPVKIFFRTPYGKVIGASTITIQQVDEGGGGISGHSKNIEINKQGKINVN